MYNLNKTTTKITLCFSLWGIFPSHLICSHPCPDLLTSPPKPRQKYLWSKPQSVFDLGKEAFSLFEAQYISEKWNLIAKRTDKLSVLEIEPFTLNSNSHQSIPSHKGMLSTQSHTGFWFWIFNCIQATGRPSSSPPWDSPFTKNRNWRWTSVYASTLLLLQTLP